MLKPGGPFRNNLTKTAKRSNLNTNTVGILMRLKGFAEEKTKEETAKVVNKILNIK